MAKPISLLKSISGKLNKAEDQVFLASTTQKATYQASFKAQSKYLTFRGYLMATVIEQLKNASQD